MQKFLVGGVDSDFYELDFAIVEAETGQDAIDKYISEVETETDLVMEVIADRSVNMGWLERFFLATDEEQDYYRQYRTSPVDWQPIVKERVIRFFRTHADWAQLYVDFYENDTLDDLAAAAYVRAHFPREMIA